MRNRPPNRHRNPIVGVSYPPESDAPADHHHGHSHDGDWRLLAALAGGCLVFGLAGYLCEIFAAPTAVTLIFFGLAYLCGGYDAAVDSFETIRHVKLDVHFLMLAVAVGAASIGAWHEGALLLFLFSASGAMEAFAMHRTRREIDSLLRGAPKSARVIEGGVERIVAVEDLVAGQTVLVTDGELIPADLEVIKGASACDESNLTGEALPVSKHVGDRALAGTLNVAGVFEGRVLRPASESSLQRIIRMIAEAQGMKAPAQRFSDRFGPGYTGIVLALCGSMFLVWWLVLGLPAFREGDQPSAFYRSMTLLVVMSPCALVLSVPSAVLSAIATGARRGVLFRGGVAVETLADVNVVALDKTGTLTTGDLRLTEAVCLRGDEGRFRQLAVSLARLSEHPLSRAIRRLGAQWQIEALAGSAVVSRAGRGIEAVVESQPAVLGSRKLVESNFGAVDFVSPQAGAAEVWVADSATCGVLFFTDELRDSAPALLAELARQGVRIVVLTGDQQAAADTLGRKAGVGDVRAGLLPEQKLAAIEELKAGGTNKVAMIGDGVNDAPCLAAADVGVAMGARGSDAALEQADVVLMNDRLESFLLARTISRKARAIIHQNIAISLGTVVLMAFGAFLYPIPLGIGVVAHEGSTVIVVLNALRLLAIRR